MRSSGRCTGSGLEVGQQAVKAYASHTKGRCGEAGSAMSSSKLRKGDPRTALQRIPVFRATLHGAERHSNAIAGQKTCKWIDIFVRIIFKNLFLSLTWHYLMQSGFLHSRAHLRFCLLGYRCRRRENIDNPSDATVTPFSSLVERQERRLVLRC